MKKLQCKPLQHSDKPCYLVTIFGQRLNHDDVKTMDKKLSENNNILDY